MLQTGQPPPDGCKVSGQLRPCFAALTICGQKAKATLVGFHRLPCPPHQVVHRRARGIAAARDLRKRPVAPQVKLEHLALLPRQERRVALEQLDLALA